jgi:hypothetical protein
MYKNGMKWNYFEILFTETPKNETGSAAKMSKVYVSSSMQDSCERSVMSAEF